MKTIRLVNNRETISLDLSGKTNLEGAQVSISGFRTGKYSPRVDPQTRLGKSGSVPTGDREVGDRPIIMSLDLTATEQDFSAYRLAMAKLLGFFTKDKAPIYLYDDQDDITDPLRRIPVRAQVELEDEDLKTPANAEGLVMQGPITLSMLDGYFEDSESVVFNSDPAGVSDGDSFEIVNDSEFESFPVMMLSARAANSLFRITHQETGRFIEVGSGDFFPGQDLTISSQTGRITVEGTEISATSLSDGSSFLSLLPGSNNFQFASAFSAVDLSVEFRRRWPR